MRGLVFAEEIHCHRRKPQQRRPRNLQGISPAEAMYTSSTERPLKYPPPPSTLQHRGTVDLSGLTKQIESLQRTVSLKVPVAFQVLEVWITRTTTIAAVCWVLCGGCWVFVKSLLREVLEIQYSVKLVGWCAEPTIRHRHRSR